MYASQTVTRASQLVELIEQRIAREKLAPGTFLGTRESLRLESGLAKATVNEALRLLSDRGLVSVRPGRGGGLFVAEEDAMVRLRHTLLSVPAGSTGVADAIPVRDALEELVAQDAARNCTAGAAAALRTSLADLEDSVGRGYAEFLRANWALHGAIADVCANEYLRAIYVGAMQIIAAARVAPASDVEDEGSYVGHRIEVHRELVDAIVAGDPARVSAAVRAHADASLTVSTEGVPTDT